MRHPLRDNQISRFVVSGSKGDFLEEKPVDIVKGNMGWIEVVVGPMFSGKSEELIRRLRRAEIARQHVQIFKPDLALYDGELGHQFRLKVCKQLKVIVCLKWCSRKVFMLVSVSVLLSLEVKSSY